MSDDQIRILIVEDDPDDHLIVRETIRDAFGPDAEIVWISDPNEAELALAAGEYDAALVDYFVNPLSGLDLIATARASGVKAPLILLTGLGDSDVDLAAEQAGASDYIEKGALNPVLIHRAIRYSISSARSSRVLAETTDMLDMTLEHTGLGIASLDQDRNVLTLNNRLRELLDYRASPPVGAALMERLGLKEPLVPETRDLALDDGRILEVACRDTPAGGSVIVCGDVTERRHQEEQLLRAKDSAEAASRSKTEFLANISHELRTPLNAIIGFSQLLLSPPPKGDTTVDPHAYVQHIHESGQRLLEMINDVISLTTLDMAQNTMIEDEVNIGALYAKVAAELGAEIERNGQTVVEEIDPLLRVWADPRALRHVIQHLVRNAVRFAGEGATIGIRTAADGDGCFVLEVCDDGPGIPKAIASMLDESFLKGETHLMKTDGLGIGLNLVRRLSDQHGGTFSVATRDGGKGTQVTFMLPPTRVIRVDAASIRTAAERAVA